MLVRSQDNEKITDRIEFSIVEVPVKGIWGIYQPEHSRLFGEYSTFEKAVKALDILEKNYNLNGKLQFLSDGTVTTTICNLFRFPTEEEIKDEE